jgi:putative membrane protein
MGWGTMLCGGVLGLLVLAALVVIVVLLFTRNSTEGGETRDRPMPTSQSPLDILKERYARGEITQEEYQEMREHLRES